MILRNKKVAIICGGPVGLTLAKHIQLKRRYVKLYERDVNVADGAQEAISFYEMNMRRKAATAVKQSLENGSRINSEDAPGKMVIVFWYKVIPVSK